MRDSIKEAIARADQAKRNRLVQEAADADLVIIHKSRSVGATDLATILNVPAIVRDPFPMPQRPLTGIAFTIGTGPIHPSVGGPFDEEPT